MSTLTCFLYPSQYFFLPLQPIRASLYGVAPSACAEIFKKLKQQALQAAGRRIPFPSKFAVKLFQGLCQIFKINQFVHQLVGVTIWNQLFKIRLRGVTFHLQKNPSTFSPTSNSFSHLIIERIESQGQTLFFNTPLISLTIGLTRNHCALLSSGNPFQTMNLKRYVGSS